MKKYIALLLVAAAITISACSSPGIEYTVDDYIYTESAPETDPEPVETESETTSRYPEQEGYVEYKNLHMGVDPVYDRENDLMVLYFEDKNVWFTENTVCYVAYISSTAANSITAVPELNLYTDMVRDDGYYCGIAMRMDDKIPLGTYEIVVSFASYTCKFDMTIE